MKFYAVVSFAILLPAVFGSFSPAINDVLNGYEDNCINQSGISLNDLEVARKNNRIPDNPMMNEFAKCMMITFNVMNNDGSVNQDPTSYTIPADTNAVLLAAERCKTLNGSNPGDTGRQVMNCFLDANQMVLGFIPRTGAQA